MSHPLRGELDLGRPGARERRLRLVRQALALRRSEFERDGTVAPPAPRQCLADFEMQLPDVRNRRAAPAPPHSDAGAGRERGAGDPIASPLRVGLARRAAP